MRIILTSFDYTYLGNNNSDNDTDTVPVGTAVGGQPPGRMTHVSGQWRGGVDVVYCTVFRRGPWPWGMIRGMIFREGSRDN